MRELRPYKTLAGAKRSLDNGGRIYNLLSRSGDEVLDASELAKAAGVYSAGMKSFLYFEMALMDLNVEGRQEVVARLSTQAMEQYQVHHPHTLKPSTVESQGQAGKTIIVSGYPVFVEDKTQFSGHIVLVVPVIMLIPIYDQFDVYEVFDTPDLRTPRTVIATTRGSKRLDGLHTRFGGVLKELYFEDKTSKDHGLYLETIYYTIKPRLSLK